MQFEGRRRVGKAFDLTPIIDMVFLLLIFFMLTSHFVREEVLPIDLPEASSGSEVVEDRLELVVSREGHILLHEHIVEKETLQNVLREELAQRTDKNVQLRGDREVPLSELVTVLDAARAAGASGVDILTEQP
ncbi:MAG: biopolymer transporter ExbD [Thiohalomonadaceae bacterium]